MDSRKKIIVLHGPNLNLLGQREPEVYGFQTLEAINRRITEEGQKKGLDTEIRQSNSEGQLINWIHEASTNCAGIIINPGAYTHYSLAIRDALAAINLPVVEVHLSNIYAREEFRSRSVISPVVTGQVSGFGAMSYLAALNILEDLINK